MSDKRVVLIHGWGAETGKLEPLRKELEQLGWQVFLPKLAGFEEPAPPNVWGIKEYSEYVNEEAVGFFGKNRYFVFGHSFGGGIAIKLASNNSEHLSGIILCAPRGISRGKSIKRLVFSTLAKTGKVLLLTPKLAEKFKKLLYKVAREHDYEKTQGIMREIFKKIISEDLKPFISKIKLPTLILWGEEDKITPISDAYFIKSVLPESELFTYKNQGHTLPYLRPNAIAQKIDLWSKQLH